MSEHFWLLLFWFFTDRVSVLLVLIENWWTALSSGIEQHIRLTLLHIFNRASCDAGVVAMDPRACRAEMGIWSTWYIWVHVNFPFNYYINYSWLLNFDLCSHRPRSIITQTCFTVPAVDCVMTTWKLGAMVYYNTGQVINVVFISVWCNEISLVIEVWLEVELQWQLNWCSYLVPWTIPVSAHTRKWYWYYFKYNLAHLNLFKWSLKT